MFLNMSVFQSLPDAWAIGQMFPVLPIQRLDEEPRRRTVLADLTCDSDGTIQKFIDLRGVKHTLEVHEQQPDEAYFMGFFLVGAYQEILGDMHNLFGDTNIVHVDLDEAGRSKLTHVLRGDRVREVLEYVDYSEADLLRSLRGPRGGRPPGRAPHLRGICAVLAPIRGRPGGLHLPASPGPRSLAGHPGPRHPSTPVRAASRPTQSTAREGYPPP